MKSPVLYILFILLTLGATDAFAGAGGTFAKIYDLNGRFVGIISPGSNPAERGLCALASMPVRTSSGSMKTLAAGVYLIDPAAVNAADTASSGALGFVDVSASYLPQDSWPAGEVHTADVNGDGRVDIVFTIASPTCDTAGADLRPRVWIQTPEGNFVDETDARIPPVSAPCYNFVLFDANGDGKPDILLTGHSCGTDHLVASLLINDGTGVFTDESATRLPSFSGIGSVPFAYFAAAAPLVNKSSPDLIVTMFGSPADTIHHIPIVPALWINDGSGHFSWDTAGHLPQPGKYGYMIPFITDINKDSTNDILFSGWEFIRTSDTGLAVDTLLGGTVCYRDTGGGHFVDETSSRIPPPDDPSIRTLVIGDVNADGAPDILEAGLPVSPLSRQLRLLVNDGTGHFSVSAGSLPDGISGWFNAGKFGRLAGHSDPDLFLTKVQVGSPDYDVLLLNQGNGRFVDSSSLLPRNLDFSVGCDFLDYDGDGLPDIVISNAGSIAGQPARNNLYHNSSLQSAWVGLRSGTTVRLHDVQMIDSLTAYVVGDSGTILKTADAGRHWKAQNPGLIAALKSVKFIDTLRGFAAGNGVFVKSTDGGNHWHQTPLTGNFVSLGLAPSGGGWEVFLGSDSGAVWYSSDGADSIWTRRQFAGGKIVDMHFAPASPGPFSARIASQLFTYSSADGGAHWDSIANPLLIPYDALFGGDLAHPSEFLVGYGGDPGAFPIVLRRASGDSTWVRRSFATLGGSILHGVAAFDASPVVYLCGSGGMIFHSTDNGDTWRQQPTATMSGLNAFSFINEFTGLAVGDGGTVLALMGGTVTSVPVRPPSAKPEAFSLSQNFPNPFNPKTSIGFSISESGPVSLTVYNLLGQEVATLVNSPLRPGRYTAEWNAGGVASGIYFYRLVEGMHVAVRKMIVLK